MDFLASLPTHSSRLSLRSSLDASLSRLADCDAAARAEGVSLLRAWLAAALGCGCAARAGAASEEALLVLSPALASPHLHNAAARCMLAWMGGGGVRALFAPRGRCACCGANSVSCGPCRVPWARWVAAPCWPC